MRYLVAVHIGSHRTFFAGQVVSKTQRLWLTRMNRFVIKPITLKTDIGATLAKARFVRFADIRAFLGECQLYEYGTPFEKFIVPAI